MEAEIFLEKLLFDGVRISVANGAELRIQPGKLPITDAEKALLKKHKLAIINFAGNGRVGRMSYQQERLWYLDQLGMGGQYLVPGIVDIAGNLDAAMLQLSINQIVQRHEILRTNFIKVKHLPCQKVHQNATIEVSLIDLTSLDAAQVHIARQGTLQDFFADGFCLERDKLFKILWIKLGPEKSVLAVAMHHIITDGWSMQVLLRELSQQYTALGKNSDPGMAPLQIQYMDYASWQRDTRREQQYLPSLEFWQEKLSGYQELDMPSDHARKAASSGRGNFLRFDLDVRRMQYVREFAQNNQVSPFSIFVASVYYMIHKFSGQSDICLGMPVANREHPELEKLIGFFVNTVVLRLNEEEIDRQTSAVLVKKIYNSLLEAQEHQGVPIEKIFELLRPQRDAGRSPVFQILINYAPPGEDRFLLGENVLEPSFDLEAQHAKFDLTFTFNESSSGPSSLFVEYATDLYNRETIESMGLQVLDRMHLFAKMPEEQLNMLQAQYSSGNWDVQKALNATASNYPAGKTIHHLFEEQAVLFPRSPAIRYEHETVTYQQLDNESSVMAAYLESVNAVQDYPVGICMEQSPQLIAAILGVVKSGAAYLAIDEAYPEAFVSFIAADSGIRVLLCDDTTYPKLEFLTSYPGLTLLNASEIFYRNKVSENSLPYASKSAEYAYLMYTSGTSGSPKGVLVSHGNVINHNYAVKGIYGLGQAVPVLQFSSPSFDIFVEEVFATLLFGGTIVMLDKNMRTDSSYLKKAIQANNVAIANFPTAYWHAIAGVDFSMTSLKTVVIGGEKAEASAFQRWYGVNPEIRVINTYGPTEATVMALYHITAAGNDFSMEVPLGVPIANTQAYVLDEMNNPVASGMHGELCISGDGLAAGYWNNKELTKQKFIFHPKLDNKRMYKTGDKARWNSKGQLEFLGRMDEQAKIRGFRVSPQYIESLLLSHQDISNVAVVVQRSGQISSLAAFIVTKGANPEEIAKFRTFLNEMVPSYMVPASIALVDSIPLKANGKVDKKALALLEANPVEIAYRAATLPWQVKVGTVWEAVLDRHPIGMDDNFFSIGGHSLMSVQLVSVLNEKYGLSFSVMDVLRHPTIGAMASQAELKSGSMASDPDIIVLKKGRPGAMPVFVIPGMPGLSDGYYEMAQQIEDSPVYGLQMKGFRDGIVLKTIEGMAKHNIDLMLKVCPSGPVRLVAHSYGCTVVYEMLHQMEGGPWQAEQVVLIDGGRFLDSENASRSSVVLFFKSLFKSFSIDDSHLLDKVRDILQRCPKGEWQEKLDSLFSESEKLPASPFFIAVWKVISSALSAAYGYPHGKLPFRMQMVIASESRGWLEAADWTDYYALVETTVVTGDHMSIIQQPDCKDWIAAIFNKKE